MYANVIALIQYFNTAVCATSVMRPGSWLSYQSGYHQHARLGTWQNLCSLCWLPCSLVGKKWAISHKKKKFLLGGNTILFFLIGCKKLFPMQQRMNLEREQTHRLLNVWTPSGTWPGLKFCEHKYLLSEFLSIMNQVHILLESSGLGMKTSI